MNKYLILFLSFSLKYTFTFSQMVPYRVGDKWGYSDTSGKMIIEPQYKLVDFFENHVAFIQTDSFSYLINEKGERLTQGLNKYGKFSSGLCPVQDAFGKAYYIDQSGKNAFNTFYRAAENFSEGLAIVSYRSKLGIIDVKGNWVREPDFDSSSIYFKSGFLMAKQKGRFFYINRYGKELILPDSIKPAGIFSEGMAAVYVEHKVKENNAPVSSVQLEFMDTSGRIVLSRFIIDSTDYTGYLNYEKEFKDGMAIVSVKNPLAYDRYFMDKHGKFSLLFSYVQHLGDSMYLGVKGYYLPSIRIYDKNFYVMGDFSYPIKSVGVSGKGLIAVQDKDGLWGYCDSNTKLIIPFLYEMAYQFNNGFAIVIKQGRFGVIDRNGKEFFRD